MTVLIDTTCSLALERLAVMYIDTCNVVIGCRG